MNLDVRTLLFAHALLSLSLAGAVLVARPGGAGEARGARAWAIAESLFALGYAMLFLVGRVPPIVSGVLANAVLLGGYFVALQALARFAGRPLPAGWWALAGCLSAAAFALPPAGPEGFAARGAIYGVVLGLITLAVLGLLRRGAADLRGAAIVRAAFLLQWGLVLVRLAGGLLDPTMHLLSERTWQVAPFAGHMVANVAATLGFLMMLHETARRAADRLARLDPLTGLLNRRGLLERLHQELARAERLRAPVSAVAIDLDHFKAINDRFGHEAGDRALAAFARLLRETARAGDVAGRLGGEEFLIVLPQQDAGAARRLAERLRAALRASPIGPDARVVTASFGVATHLGGAGPIDSDALLRAADARLYEAKRTRDAVA